MTDFSPTNIGLIPLEKPACVAWVDASDTSTENITSVSNSVSAIKNKANSQITITQGTSARQPKTGLVSYNGLNVLSFTAANTQFLNFSSNKPLSEPFTVFVVGQANTSSSGTDRGFIGRQTSSIAGQWVLLRNANFSIFQSYLFGSGGLDSGATQPSNTNANIHTVTFQNGGTLRYQLNNNTATLGNTRSGYNNNVTTGLALGASNASGGAPLDGWIGEVIIYNSVLSAGDITEINNYLSRKWGISVS